MTDPSPDPLSSSIRATARDAIGRAWEAAVAAGTLPALPERARPVAIEVERPANPDHGDFATNLAMKLARPYRMAPLAIATALAAELDAEAAGDPAATPDRRRPRSRRPASSTCACATPRSRRRSRRSSPTRRAGAGSRRSRPRSVNVEFVSANPTGPLHVGNARGAFVGDLLSRVLEAGGQRVTREYYFNDSGGQIRNLGASVAALRRGEPVPEDGYHGDYVHDLAADAARRRLGRRDRADGADTDGSLGRWAAGRVRAGIEASLDAPRRPLRRLDERGARSTTRAGSRGRSSACASAATSTSRTARSGSARPTFGDDKDRVIFRSNGEPTYFAADIGYVTEKFSRGFDHLIYIWGADHHGTVARVRNAAEAMGYDRDAVQILLYSWVRFVRDGEEVSMSKRAGEFITLDELLAEVGVDAARWFFASRAATTEHRLRHRAGQEAVEREPRLLRPVRARPDRLDPAQGGRRRAGARRRDVDGALAGAPEAALARAIVALPRGRRGRRRGRGDARHHRLRDRAGDDVPRLLPRRAGRRCRTSRSGRPARLALAEAARITLANALGLLGISAPESM